MEKSFLTLLEEENRVVIWDRKSTPIFFTHNISAQETKGFHRRVLFPEKKIRSQTKALLAGKIK